MNAKYEDGRTALDFAQQNGQTEVVEILKAAGGKSWKAVKQVNSEA